MVPAQDLLATLLSDFWGFILVVLLIRKCQSHFRYAGKDPDINHFWKSALASCLSKPAAMPDGSGRWTVRLGTSIGGSEVTHAFRKHVHCLSLQIIESPQIGSTSMENYSKAKRCIIVSVWMSLLQMSLSTTICISSMIALCRCQALPEIKVN